MIEVVIDSVRVSLMTQHRLVVLKDMNSERYLTIFIDAAVAEAITNELHQQKTPRPMTHDLLHDIVRELGGSILHVLINKVQRDIYYARIVLESEGREVDIDSRSSDAIALAVRAQVPIYVDARVMERVAMTPDAHVIPDSEDDDEGAEVPVDEGRLSVFTDFVNTLKLDDVEDDEK